jgi:hypothetical protein
MLSSVAVGIKSIGVGILIFRGRYDFQGQQFILVISLSSFTITDTTFSVVSLKEGVYY